MPDYTSRKKIPKPVGAEPMTTGLLQSMADQIDEYGEWLANNYANDVTLTYTDGNLTKVEEYVGGLLRKEEVLAYTNGNLTSVTTKVFAEDGTVEAQFTDTLSYTNGNLTGVERTVV